MIQFLGSVQNYVPLTHRKSRNNFGIFYNYVSIINTINNLKFFTFVTLIVSELSYLIILIFICYIYYETCNTVRSFLQYEMFVLSRSYDRFRQKFVANSIIVWLRKNFSNRCDTFDCWVVFSSIVQLLGFKIRKLITLWN